MRHILSAIKEFAARYWEVFKAAWSVRATLDAPKRSKDELAFLPAHLELTDTPVSPTARWVMRTIMALFCVALLWSIFGRFDIVAVAPGKTVVSSRTKVIQSAETAVVKRILVRDGQTVKRGDLLIELDSTGTAADYDRADEALIAAQLASLRYRALATSLDTDLPPVLAGGSGLSAARLASEQQLAASDFGAYKAKRQNLEASIAQRKAEIQTVQGSIEPLVETAAIATTRAQDYAKLVKDKYVGRHDYLLREQERIAAESDLAARRSQLLEANAALSVAKRELGALTADMRQQTLDHLREASGQVQQFSPELAKADSRNRLMQLRAPVDGTVQQLAVHTIRGVVTPAQALLAVVPSEETLEVETTLLNKDIGFVRPGQRATVKIDSFPYTRYGYLQGTVESVSHDAAQDEKIGLVFPARIKLEQADLVIEGSKVKLTPGMTLSVEIRTGTRSALSYFLSPLVQRVDESMRER